ncbi:unnamed protein product [Triticum turgidum subsp. durum]|uniref:lipid-A-disaccharide synthase n=1 Tax=Triticum turgidum subsp. durum TaxID=4567 RepID=A0A9R0RPL9_TRITD|nr:unnamed protein product [Triticum turgidum subsp. durum]
MLSRWIPAAGRQRGLLARLGSRAYSCGRVFDAAVRDGELRVFVVAGEVSGDSLASRLMASLRKLSPVPVRFAGVGGELMCKEGLQSLFPMEEIAIMGLWELLPHIYNVKVHLWCVLCFAFCLCSLDCWLYSFLCCRERSRIL